MSIVKWPTSRTLRGCRGIGGVTRLVAVCTIAVSLAACENLLDVEVPGSLSADAIRQPVMADVMVNSVRADFECAYSSFATFTASFTDELMSASSFGNVDPVDRRWSNIESGYGGQCSGSLNVSTTGFYNPLQIARVQAATTLELLAGFSDAEVADRNRKTATVHAYLGYTLVLLGEAFCAMALDGGPLMTPGDVLALAESRFTTAIDAATTAGSPDIVNWATLGRARVRVNPAIGNLSGALSDAQSIPAGFAKNATYDAAPGRRTNYFSQVNVKNRYWTLDVDLRNLMVEGVPDTRLLAFQEGIGHDGFSQLWTQSKYREYSDPIPLATWEEAQLIIAEIQGGQAAVDAINAIRGAHGLPTTFSSTDPAVIRNELLYERRVVLFGQGHRISDIVRFPDVNHRTGLRPHKGDAYDNVYTCLPLPTPEYDTNPNF